MSMSVQRKSNRLWTIKSTELTVNQTIKYTTAKEQDIGVTIQADLKVSEQCGIAARKGNQLSYWE